MITHALVTSYGEHLPLSCSPLKYQRLLRGWSQRELADTLQEMCAYRGEPAGICIDMISRWENGHRKPSPLYRKHLCTLYGLSAAQLGLLEGLEVQP